MRIGIDAERTFTDIVFVNERTEAVRILEQKQIFFVNDGTVPKLHKKRDN